MKADSLHWKKDKILSLSCLFNFVVGARGVGKTWQFKKWAIDNYLYKDNRAVWIMRYKTELDDAIKDNKFFDDMLEFYPDFQFKIEKYTAYIKTNDGDEWQRFIMFKALSERSLKAISDKSVTIMVFDEFIPLPGIPYLKNEVERFLEFYLTISRGRDLRAFFLSNNVTIACPYFEYFHVNLPKQGNITRNGDIAIENVKNIDFAESMKNTRFGKMIKDTHYAKYAIENETFVDLKTFVTKRPNTAHCIVCIRTNIGLLYLWSVQPSSLFVSLQGDPNCIQWALTDAEHTETSEYIGFTGHYAKNIIRSNYSRGTLFFDSEEAKARFMATCQKFIK